jgi:hypothetical protein
MSKFAWQLPPKWVLEAARSEVNRTNTWDRYFAILAIFYGIKAPKSIQGEAQIAKVQEQFPADQKVVAIYVPHESTIYALKEGFDESTALHEFFHHLMSNTKLNDKEAEQALANAYAQACLNSIHAQT